MTLTKTIKTGSILFLMLAGCTAPHAVNTIANGTIGAQNAKYIQASVSITISQNGNQIYSDSTPNSSLILKAGQTYDLNLGVINAPNGTTYSLAMTNIDQVVQVPVNVALTDGDNVFTVPNAGDYTWKLVLTATGYNDQTKNYSATVQCPSANFQASDLDASKILVTQAAGQNLYNYDATQVVKGSAGGSPPYQCAWDITGVGIADTTFHDCSQVEHNAYVNYVSTRNIGLIVRDACNTAFTISNSQNLTYAVPASPGNVFIAGQTANSSANDPRFKDVTYLATNNGGYNIVLPSYSHQAKTFSITSAVNYGMSSSVTYGVDIELQNFVENPALVTMPTDPTINAGVTFDTTGVTVKKLTYSVDQAGDQNPAQTFSNGSCTVAVQAKVIDPGGQPCTQGNTGNFTAPTVEVWGTYTCTGLHSSAGNSIDYSGSFDGYDMIVDNCTGGGQGGGGVPPLKL